MIKSLLFLGVACLSLVDIIAYAQAVPVAMTISTSKYVVKSDDDTFIDIKIQNISKKPFSMGHTITMITTPTPYKVHVTDQFGNLLSYRKDERHPEQGLPWSKGSLVTILPGEFFVERLVLDDLVDISKPGRYAVEIDRTLLSEWGGWKLHSNPVTVTVVQ